MPKIMLNNTDYSTPQVGGVTREDINIIANELNRLNTYETDSILPDNYYYNDANASKWVFERLGDIVTITTSSLKNVPANQNVTLFGSIPEKYRPRQYKSQCIYDTNTGKAFSVHIYTNGNIVIYNYTGSESSSHTIKATITYIGVEL